MTPSGSRTPLLLFCQFWSRPEVKGPPEDPSEFSEYGTATHTVAELLQKKLPVDMDALAVQHRLSEYDRDQCLIDGTALSQWIDENVTGVRSTEGAYAFNTDDFTARLLMTNGHRDYSDKRESEYCGTLDLVAVDGPLAIVVDYKTGVTAAESYREQLEFGALVVSLTNPQVRRVRCVVLKVSDGVCYPLQWEVDTSDIDDIGLQIQIAFQAIPNAEPQPGRHCYERYCPLAGTCPATVGAILPIIKEHNPEETTAVTAADIPTDMEITTLAQALRLYDLWRKVKKMDGALEKGLQRYADGVGGLPVAPGKVWAADEGSREYIRLTAAAEEYLKSTLGPKFDAIEANISKQSLKKASGTRLETVLEGLRKCGATKPSSFVQYKERKAS